MPPAFRLGYASFRNNAVAAELHPQSLYGYDIWAGEHLNFISSKNPDIEVVRCYKGYGLSNKVFPCVQVRFKRRFVPIVQWDLRLPASGKVTAVESVIGSWFIEYEKVDAAADENTIYAADVEDSDK